MSHEHLATALNRLHTEGGTGNRLVVSAGPAWLVIRARRGALQARCIAASTRHLPDALKLGPGAISALRGAGFALPAGARCLERGVDLTTDASRTAVADLLVDLLRRIYRQSADALALDLTLGDAPTTTNAALHDAMRALAKRRNPDARHAVYRALLRADLLLIVEPDGTPRSFGTLGSADSYAVFTTGAAAERWDPRGLPAQVVPGWRLFPRLSRLRPGSLLINPSGTLGGELYRGEIDAIARVCPPTPSQQ